MAAGGPYKHTLVLWHVSDSRRGHDNQCLGLIQGLRQLRPCEYYKISSRPFIELLIPLFSGRFSAGEKYPDPDLIIGAGHATNAAMLCARAARHGRTVVLMRPGLPTSWFDVCLIPAHDQPHVAPNIIKTEGPLTRVIPSDNHDCGKGLFLIGGPSRHYSWDSGQLLAQIEQIVENTAVQWLITDSPRTPVVTSRALGTLTSPSVEYVPWQSVGAAWLNEQLAKTGYIWISEDSVSMIYEALTSGGAVGLLGVPRKRHSRITGIPDQLCAKGLITTYRDWLSGQSLTRPAVFLNESKRCAELVLSMFAL